MMHKKVNRCERVAQQLKRELAELIQFEMRDPRLGMVTITDVVLSRDLRYAKVFFTVLEATEIDVTQILNRSVGFLRTQLSQRVELFKMPELRFIYDHSVVRGMELAQLIDQTLPSSS